MRAPGSQQSTKTETKAGGAGPVDPFLPQTLPKRANKEQTLPAPGHTAPCARPPGSGSTSRAGGKRRPSALGCAPPSPTPRQRPTRKRCLLPSLASQFLHDTAMVLCPPPPPQATPAGLAGCRWWGRRASEPSFSAGLGRSSPLPTPHPRPVFRPPGRALRTGLVELPVGPRRFVPSGVPQRPCPGGFGVPRASSPTGGTGPER